MEQIILRSATQVPGTSCPCGKHLYIDIYRFSSSWFSTMWHVKFVDLRCRLSLICAPLITRCYKTGVSEVVCESSAEKKTRGRKKLFKQAKITIFELSFSLCQKALGFMSCQRVNIQKVISAGVQSSSLFINLRLEPSGKVMLQVAHV